MKPGGPAAIAATWIVPPPAKPPHRGRVLLVRRRLPHQLRRAESELPIWRHLSSCQLHELHDAAVQASRKVVAGARLAVGRKLHAVHAVATADGRSRGIWQNCAAAAVCCTANAPNLDCTSKPPFSASN